MPQIGWVWARMNEDMTRLLLITLVAVLCPSLCVGQSSDAGKQRDQADSPPAQAVPGSAASQSVADETVLAVELVKSLDSKKAKEGDEIIARTTSDAHTSDGVRIPRGSSVVGHITECKARSKGDAESAMGIAFDKVVFRDGKDIAVKFVIQAVGPSAALASHDGEPGRSFSAFTPGCSDRHQGGESCRDAGR